MFPGFRCLWRLVYKPFPAPETAVKPEKYIYKKARFI